MTFEADYEGAIVVEARNYGFRSGDTIFWNNPKAFCLHTPEEPADNHASTPEYFATTDSAASTHYFVSYTGKVYQCVPERHGAYANAVKGKPYPPWAEPGINLNLQTLSIEIEGYAVSIHETMTPGHRQWQALVALMADRCQKLNIPPERTFGHYTVASNRTDPGALDIGALIQDVTVAMEEFMPTEAEWNEMKASVEFLKEFRDAQMALNTDLDQQADDNTKDIQAIHARLRSGGLTIAGEANGK